MIQRLPPRLTVEVHNKNVEIILGDRYIEILYKFTLHELKEECSDTLFLSWKPMMDWTYVDRPAFDPSPEEYLMRPSTDSHTALFLYVPEACLHYKKPLVVYASAPVKRDIAGIVKGYTIFLKEQSPLLL